MPFLHRRERWDMGTYMTWATFTLLGMLIGNWVPSNTPSGGAGCNPSGSLYSYTPRPAKTRDDSIFAEMLVHPGMLAADPQNIVGIVLAEAPSAVICETLKYMSVTEVLVFPPIKPAAGNGPQIAAPAGFSSSFRCASDPRVKEVQWTSQAASKCKSIDTIIIDGAPAGRGIPATTSNAMNTSTWNKLQCLLETDGTFIFPIGSAPTAWESSRTSAARAQTESQLALINKVAVAFTFEAAPGKKGESGGGVHVYDTYVEAAGVPLSFVVICRNKECGGRWQRNEAAIEMGMQRRMFAKDARLKWYDGTTHTNIQYPARAWEDAFCFADNGIRLKKVGHQCNAALSKAVDASPIKKAGEDDVEDDPESFAVRYGPSGFANTKSDVEGAEWMKTDKQDNGVFAVRDLKEGDRFLYDAATAMEFPFHIYEGIDRLAEETKNEHFQGIIEWIDRYAFGCYGLGGEFSYWVSASSRMTMVNHGCNVTNVGDPKADDIDEPPWEPWDVAGRRHTRSFCVASALREDVKKGGQLLEDYGRFEGADNQEDKDMKAVISSWCTPEKVAAAKHEI